MALEFPIELKFRMLIFEQGGKPENPEKNPRREVGGWWEASALTTAPPLLFFCMGVPIGFLTRRYLTSP